MRKIIRGLAFFILMMGVGVLLYPFASEYIAKYQIKNTIEDYNKDIKTKSDDYLNTLLNEINTYNKEIFENNQEGLADPFLNDNIKFSLEEYGVKDNIFGSIYIPKINITLPLYFGHAKSILAKGAGIMSRTSIPVGGSNTNSVIAAHRGYKTQKMFKHIEELEIGDSIKITNPWETLNYKIVDLQVILPTEIDKVKIVEGKDLIMLVTCHPYTVNTHRYVVIAQRDGNINTKEIKNLENKKIIDSSKDKIRIETTLKYIGLGIAVTIILIAGSKLKKGLQKK